MNVSQIIVRSVQPSEEPHYTALMQQHHYLGALPKIGNTIWYVATTQQDEWVALLSFSAAALKYKARDQWIGWSFRYQYNRLHLIANNSRFLILPHHHHKNLASKILSLCRKRIQQDWLDRFGIPLLLLETFVDPTRFVGTIYQASNWELIGETKGYSRIQGGYGNTVSSPKLAFVLSLQRNARKLLAKPLLDQRYAKGGLRMQLTADQMRSLPDFFRQIKDPRRRQGRRHAVHVVLAIATGAVLCGMRGYKAISDWTQSLSPKALQRFGCRRRHGKYTAPSESTIRNVLIRIDPSELDKALQLWNEHYGASDESLAIDGKTMCNAIDENGKQTHIMSAIGHDSKQCYTQKKSALCPLPEVTKKNRPMKLKSPFHSSTASTFRGKPLQPMHS